MISRYRTHPSKSISALPQPCLRLFVPPRRGRRRDLGAESRKDLSLKRARDPYELLYFHLSPQHLVALRGLSIKFPLQVCGRTYVEVPGRDWKPAMPFRTRPDTFRAGSSLIRTMGQ